MRLLPREDPGAGQVIKKCNAKGEGKRSPLERMDNMIKISEKDKKVLEREITEILRSAVSDDYARYILESCQDEDDDDGSMTFMDAVVDDVLTSSAWEDEGYYSNDDIRLAIGRVLLSRLGIDY